MNGHQMHSVFTGLRWGLHALVAALVVLVLFRAAGLGTHRAWWGAALTLAWALAYAIGVYDGARRGRAARSAGVVGAAPAGTQAGSVLAGGTPLPAIAGVLLLSVLWAAAAFCLPEAAYLVFPLFFLQLHLLGSLAGPLAVAVSTVVAIVALGVQQGFSLPAAIGPCLGAAVALIIGLGYRAIMRQAHAREELVAQLLATRDELARTERRAGEEAERSRLARDIHDTVSQSLSSVQMLLHAAERAPDHGTTLRHVALARETAAAAQAETRAIVRALTPAPLEDDSLSGALRRLARGEWADAGHGRVELELTAEDEARLGALEMSQQTALLRLAQGAVGNALQHAGAAVVRVRAGADDDAAWLEVRDDGVGFDPSTAPGAGHGPGHFGLASMRERADQMGGRLEVNSSRGQGTAVRVRLPLSTSDTEARTS